MGSSMCDPVENIEISGITYETSSDKMPAYN